MNADRPPQQDRDDPDHDPTGIRDLLASLPDPGPMPPDLVARITSSIAQERAALGRAEATDPVVTPLVRRRPLWQRAGLVAAGLLVVGAAGSTLTGTTPADLAARLTTSSSAGDSAAGAAQENTVGDSLSQQESGGSEAEPPAADQGGTDDQDLTAGPSAGPSAGSPAGQDDRLPATGTDDLTATGTAYTTVALATQARTTLDRWLRSARGVTPPLDDRTTSSSLLSTPDGLEDCLLALLLPANSLIGADLATLDGAQAAVIVVRDDTGNEAYAVRPDCRTGAPGVLAGPVRLP